MSLLKKFFLPVEMNHEITDESDAAAQRSKTVKCKAKISHTRFCDVLSELNQILEKKDPEKTNE